MDSTESSQSSLVVTPCSLEHNLTTLPRRSACFPSVSVMHQLSSSADSSCFIQRRAVYTYHHEHSHSQRYQWPAILGGRCLRDDHSPHCRHLLLEYYRPIVGTWMWNEHPNRIVALDLSPPTYIPHKILKKCLTFLNSAHGSLDVVLQTRWPTPRTKNEKLVQ